MLTTVSFCAKALKRNSIEISTLRFSAESCEKIHMPNIRNLDKK